MCHSNARRTKPNGEKVEVDDIQPIDLHTLKC